MTPRKNMAPNVTGTHAEAEHRSNPYKKEETMTSTVPHPSENSDAQFILSTGHARIWVKPALHGRTGESIVELTDDYESNMLLSPAEALSVAAALTAVATHVLEEESRFITRRTAPGQPAFEEAI